MHDTASFGGRIFVHSFPPIAARGSRVLVLGSMPGKASLRAGQYYAHPRNAFWTITATLFGFEADASYTRRVAALRRSGVALWDVIQTCTRESSLDSDIDDATLVPNEFADFFAKHRSVHAVFFNGAKAESSYRRHVMPTLPADLGLTYLRLPSTSPANASIPYARKLTAWRAVRDRSRAA
jgi:TDG/mug DNA glycosylase family protein